MLLKKPAGRPGQEFTKALADRAGGDGFWMHIQGYVCSISGVTACDFTARTDRRRPEVFDCMRACP